MPAEVRLLGPVSIRDASGCEVSELSRQPRLVALLACLAVPPEGTLVRRDTLLAWFWPEVDSEHARGTLRTALYRLRSLLGPDMVVTRGAGEVGVAPHLLWCDAREFDAQTGDVAPLSDGRAARLSETLGLYRGSFLEGFHAGGVAVSLDDWIARHRARLERRACATAIALAEYAGRGGHWAAAVEYARSAVAVDPLDEGATRVLMTGLRAAGDEPGALRAYRDFEAALDREVGAAPSAVMQAMLADVRPPQPAELAEPAIFAGAAAKGQEKLARLAGAAEVTRSRTHWRRFAVVAAATLVAVSMTPLMFQQGKAVGDSATPGVVQAGEPRAPVWRTLPTSSAVPLPREHHVAALSADGERVLVFGGRVGATVVGDLWELDGIGTATPGRWTRRIQGSEENPGPRWMVASAYDSSGDRLLTFGGALGYSAPCSNEVWLLADAFKQNPTWRRIAPGGDASPAPRADARAALDAQHARLLVYGGHDCVSGAFGDAWILMNAFGSADSARWLRLSPDTSAGSPGPRRGHSLAFDPVSGTAILFGGLDATLRAHGDVWLLTGTGPSGRPAWRRLETTGGGPPARGYHTAVLDPETNRLMVFGGVDRSGSPLDDVWVLVGANGATPVASWQQLRPPGDLPPGRLTHVALYDSRNDRMIVHGGMRGGLRLGDLWVLGSATGR